MTKRRRKYAQEFKEEAVMLILEHGYKITGAVKNFGIHPNYPTQVKGYSFRRNLYNVKHPRPKTTLQM